MTVSKQISMTVETINDLAKLADFSFMTVSNQYYK
jgi:hypothetical protein